MHRNYEVGWGDDPYVVNEVRTVLGEDGEIKKELSVAGYPNTMATFVVSEQLETPALNTRGSTYINFVQSAANGHRKFVTPDEISAGDIVFLIKDHRSEIVRIFLYHDYDNPVFSITDVRRGDVINQRRLTSGYVLKQEGNAFGFSFSSPNATVVDEVAIYTSPSASAIIYDKDSRGEKVYIGTVGEVLTAESSPSDASFIVTMRDKGTPRMTIIYK